MESRSLSSETPPSLGKLFLGLPFWGHKGWAGNFYRPRTPAKQYLAQYGSVFNTVEGNTTFYSLPSPASVMRWRDSVPESFRFSFKLPRLITHELQLVGAHAAMDEFVERMAPLREHLGAFLVQLPPSFGPDRLSALDRFLAAYPLENGMAVEVRHQGLFDPHPASRRLDEILHRHGAERCWMDTRALRSGDGDLPEVRTARSKKPDSPVRIPAQKAALSVFPMVRFVAHPDYEVTKPWVVRWTRVLAHWIHQGRSPYFMVHLPDNVAVPGLARTIHDVLAARAQIDPLPSFPADLPTPDPAGGQLSLL